MFYICNAIRPVLLVCLGVNINKGWLLSRPFLFSPYNFYFNSFFKKCAV